MDNCRNLYFPDNHIIVLFALIIVYISVAIGHIIAIFALVTVHNSVWILCHFRCGSRFYLSMLSDLRLSISISIHITCLPLCMYVCVGIFVCFFLSLFVFVWIYVYICLNFCLYLLVVVAVTAASKAGSLGSCRAASWPPVNLAPQLLLFKYFFFLFKYFCTFTLAISLTTFIDIYELLEIICCK